MGFLRNTPWTLLLHKHTFVARRASLVIALVATFCFVPFFFVFDRETVIEEHGFTQSLAYSSVDGQSAYPLIAYLTNRVANTCQLLTDADDGAFASDQMATCLTQLLTLADVPNMQSDSPPIPQQFTDGWSTGNRPMIYRQHFEEFSGAVRSQNIIAIVPSARGDKRDCLFLNFATDWWRPANDAEAAAVGIALVWHLTHQINWLSRDVVVLFSNKRLPFAAGTRAFMRAYNTGGASEMSAKYDLDKHTWKWGVDSRSFRRGVMIAGTVVEYDAHNPNVLLLDVEGVDGVLPNQDAVNSVAEEARTQHISVVTRPVWTSILRHALNTGGRCAHTPLLERSIPAFTVRGLNLPKQLERPFPAIRLLKTLEKSVRGQSNVLQTLHHSFSLYYFTSATSHITNGVYLYIMPVILLPVIVKAVLSASVALNIPKVVLGFALVVGVGVVGSLPPYILATRAVFGGPFMDSAGLRYCGGTYSFPTQLTAPECSPLYEDAMPIYLHRVAIWVVVLIACYSLCGAAVVLLARRMPTGTPPTTNSSTPPTTNSSTNKGSSRRDGGHQELWEFVSLALRVLVCFFLLFLSFLNWSLGVLLALVLWVPCAVVEPVRLVGPQPRKRKLSASIMITLWIAVLVGARSPRNADVLYNSLVNNGAVVDTLGSLFGRRDIHQSVVHNTQMFWDYNNANTTVVPMYEECDSGAMQHFARQYEQGHMFSPSALGFTAHSLLWRVGGSYAHLLNKSAAMFVYTLVQNSVCVGDWLTFLVFFAILPLVYTSLIVMFILPVDTIDVLEEMEDD